ncbi:MAG: ester cyclase [Bacteroidetes bacterium]|jgi:steroid delta-isomerase-like uncharacterized protein|nr:ester cyclase [Bacteroidota bacterium]|tara:strand:- start:53183 stop:53704 length:522 start_codon:yes stop_codon:yes gene_type:complete
MKRNNFYFNGFTLLLLSFIIISCNNPSKKHLDLEKAQIQLDLDLKTYESVWDKVINERQIDLINETYFDENITGVAKPENIVGIENFKAYYNNYLIGFSDGKITFINVFGQGDNIVKQWNFKGTHDGDFFGTPATNKKVDVSGTTIVKMKDGKIQSEENYMDNLDFYTQLGLM